jgi:hypothetical protein
MMKKKEAEIIENCKTYFQRFQEAFAKSDKKTFKENLLPFFSAGDDIKLLIKEPYPKFEEK